MGSATASLKRRPNSSSGHYDGSRARELNFRFTTEHRGEVAGPFWVIRVGLTAYADFRSTPSTDIVSSARQVRLVPEAEIVLRRKQTMSLSQK